MRGAASRRGLHAAEHGGHTPGESAGSVVSTARQGHVGVRVGSVCGAQTRRALGRVKEQTVSVSSYALGPEVSPRSSRAGS